MKNLVFWCFPWMGILKTSRVSFTPPVVIALRKCSLIHSSYSKKAYCSLFNVNNIENIILGRRMWLCFPSITLLQFGLSKNNQQSSINFFHSPILIITPKYNTVFQYYLLLFIIYDYILTLINNIAYIIV